jgi:hypothetical protein
MGSRRLLGRRARSQAARRSSSGLSSSGSESRERASLESYPTQRASRQSAPGRSQPDGWWAPRFELDSIEEFASVSFVGSPSRAHSGITRAVDAIPDDFSIVFIQCPPLAELDYTISKVEVKIHVYQEGKKLEPGYRQNWKNKNPEFLSNNYTYLGISKNKFNETLESKVKFSKKTLHCVSLW